jgi:rod shape-determining protein MreD
MSNYIGIPILVTAAILNVTVMAALQLGGGTPDLVFLLVVSWAMLVDLPHALFWAVVGGVTQDMLSVAPLGTSALGLVVVAFVADSIFGDVPRTNLLIPPVVAAAGTVVYHLGILAVLWLVDYRVPLERGLFYVTLPTVIYNTILIVPVFRILGMIHRWLTPHRVRLG